MSADQLRRAAKVLREHATGVPASMTGRWSTRAEHVIADDGTDVGMLVIDAYQPADDAALLAFIALVDPPVALALAGWLDEAAVYVDAYPGTLTAADAVARAILRETS